MKVSVQMRVNTHLTGYDCLDLSQTRRSDLEM